MTSKLEGSDQMFGVDLMLEHPYSYVLYRKERMLVHAYTMQNHGYKRGQEITKKHARFLHFEFSSICETKKILFNIFKKNHHWQ